MRDWRERFRSRVFAFDAPRVLTSRAMHDLATSEGMAFSDESTAAVAIARLAADMERNGILRKIRRGLYLNNVADPRPHHAEAVEHIRLGAFVSLQTVLGDAAVLNNYTEDFVTCVVPRTKGTHVRRIEVGFPGARFSFHSIPEDVLEAGSVDDRISSAHPRRVAPEAALVHWTFLAREGTMPVPPSELDLQELDLDRLRRLARETGLSIGVENAIGRAAEHARDHDASDNGVATMGF